MIANQPPGRGHGQPCSLEDAQRLVIAWQESQQPMSAWCREQGVRRSAMHSYLRRTQPTPLARSEASFIQLTPRPESKSRAGTICVRLGASGATAELSLPQLAMLLDTMAGSPS